jgi:hypothetical protein
VARPCPISQVGKNHAGAYDDHGAALTSRRDPDIYVTAEDIIAEADKVVVRITWRATDSQTGKRIQFGGIVIR